MKIIGLIFFTFLVQNISGQVEVKLYNKTGYHLDSVTIGQTYVGNLFNDSSATIIMEQLLNQGGTIASGVSGNIQRKNMDTEYVWPCGTGIEIVKKGKYELDIILHESEKGFLLFLKRHN